MDQKKHIRGAITRIVIVIIIVLVVAAVGGTYYVLYATPTVKQITTTGTVPVVVTTSSSVSTALGSYQTYKGTFNYITPLGPLGINYSNGKLSEWNSTQTATGTFTFSINSLTYTGNGTGQGSIIVSTHGYCTGSVTVLYTFVITATHVPGENFIVAFNTPTPPTAMVSLTCEGSTQGFSTSNNPVTFVSVYPTGLSATAFPTTESQSPQGGISYTVTVSPSS